ncbi:septation protein SepH [Streptomyces sp. ODS28]|uniref:septation protein SepH n=1 Tax=Streptomyces sp. ODS28 TaxID=3136688 RepID=UPI0031E5D9B1
MPELRVVAVSNDGTRLVLKAADSTEYTLPIDERLRAAVRNDRARLGQIEIEVESHLRPRDIQARIRAGASAEEVAQLAGISVDRVRRFEGPVLAERAFMAERARKTPVRRPGENAGPQLGEAVSERLLVRGADKDTVHWDSWRRDDGTWEVLLAYRVAGRPHSATWTYDPPRRLVQAVDDEARALIGESDDTPEPSFPFVPRIARLPREHTDGEPQEERGPRGEAGALPSAPVREEPVAAADEGEPDSLTSLLEAVPNFRGDMVVPEQQAQEPAEEEPQPAAYTERDRGDRDRTTERERPERDRTERLDPERLDRDRPDRDRIDRDRLDRDRPERDRPDRDRPDRDRPERDRSDRERPEPEPEEPAAEEEPVEPPAPAASAGAAYADVLMPRSVAAHRDRLKGTTDRQAEADGVRPGRRAAVPSWDEIVFGTRRKKD